MDTTNTADTYVKDDVMVCIPPDQIANSDLTKSKLPRCDEETLRKGNSPVQEIVGVSKDSRNAN
jgi:hypothetical protein